MPDPIEIAPLASYPGSVQPLAAWFVQEWPEWYGPGGPGDAADDLEQRCRVGCLPLALVALWDGELCGTAALTPTSVPSHARLGPWLSGLLVAPGFRRRGVAERLVGAIEAAARDLGYGRLYAAIGGGDATPRTALRKRGWRVVDSAGEQLYVYSTTL